MFAPQATQAPFYKENPLKQAVATDDEEHVVAPPGHLTQADETKVYPVMHVKGAT